MVGNTGVLVKDTDAICRPLSPNPSTTRQQRSAINTSMAQYLELYVYNVLSHNRNYGSVLIDINISKFKISNTYFELLRERCTAHYRVYMQTV